MAKIHIKQINNNPANTGGLVIFNGVNNVWSNNDDGAILVSKGTTAQRPGIPTEGMIRYNTDVDCLESYVSGSWTCLTFAGSGLGQGGQINFWHDAGTENVWFQVNTHHQQPSGPESIATSAPAIMPFAGIVYGMTFINQVDSTETDLEFYVNGSLVYTWAIRDRKWAYKTNGLSALTFSAGDRISLFAKQVTPGVKPSATAVDLFYTFTSAATGENGASAL